MAKYKTFTVTADWLLRNNACVGGIFWFHANFPDGLKISNDQVEMSELVASIDWGRSLQFLVWFVMEFYDDINLYVSDTRYEDSDILTDSCAAFISDLRMLK
jgi:hypothetical protein